MSLPLLPILATLGLTLLLSACTTPAAYGPAKDDKDWGYAVTAATDGLMHVSFRGNSENTVYQVSDYAYYRAAQLALESGCERLIILQEQRSGRAGTAAGTPAEGWNISGAPTLSRDASFQAVERTTASIPNTVPLVEISGNAREPGDTPRGSIPTSPRCSVLVKLLRSGEQAPATQGWVIDARELMSTIQKRRPELAR